jgi:hypothetical protein
MESMQERKDRMEAEQEELKRIRAIMVKLKQSVRSDITQHGHRTVQLHYEYVRDNPSAMLIVNGLSHEQVLSCYSEVLNEQANK